MVKYFEFIGGGLPFHHRSIKMFPFAKNLGALQALKFTSTDAVFLYFYSILFQLIKFSGTSACNGDSGGGFVVFIPDVTGNTSAHAQGSWYIRGIVSTSVSRIDEPVCDPSHYVVFTDVFKLREWITRNME